MRKHSIKNTRINGEVQRELSLIIRNELKDPRISMMTSVTSAEVAPDLKTCKVYISVLGSEKEREATMAGLESGAGFLRHKLAQNLNLRNTPELILLMDNSIEYGVKMSHLIDQVVEHDQTVERGEATAAGDEDEEA